MWGEQKKKEKKGLGALREIIRLFTLTQFRLMFPLVWRYAAAINVYLVMCEKVFYELSVFTSRFLDAVIIKSLCVTFGAAYKI